MKKCPDSKEVLQERILKAREKRIYPSKEEQATEQLQVRLTKEKKEKLKKFCELNNTTPSKKVNEWIDEYISTEEV